MGTVPRMGAASRALARGSECGCGCVRTSRVACYLSGGIGSCAVLGFASRLSSRPLRAYTLSFDHAGTTTKGPGARAGSAVWSRVHAASDVRADQLADHFSDCDLSRRTSVCERACDRQIPASARLSAIPASRWSSPVKAATRSSPAIRTSGAILVLCASNGSGPATTGAPPRRARCGQSRVVRNAHAPRVAGARRREARARVRAFEPRRWAQIGKGLLQVVNCELSARVRRCDTYRVMLSCPRCPATTDRSSSREPVALHLGQDDACRTMSSAILATAWRWRTPSKDACRFSTTTSWRKRHGCR